MCLPAIQENFKRISNEFQDLNEEIRLEFR